MLYDQGVCFENQITLPACNDIDPEDKEKIFQNLRERFNTGLVPYYQLPAVDPDPFISRFYTGDNWFARAFDKSGYHPRIVAKALKDWLSVQGSITTIILVGDDLSLAKEVFNGISRSFPRAIIGEQLNDLKAMAVVSSQASIYCLPFVSEKPTPVVAHILEGNSTTTHVGPDVIHVRAVPYLIHCNNEAVACHFLRRGSKILHLQQPYTDMEPCYNYRKELAEFVRNAGPDACFFNIHCRQSQPLCSFCQNPQ